MTAGVERVSEGKPIWYEMRAATGEIICVWAVQPSAPTPVPSELWRRDLNTGQIFRIRGEWEAVRSFPASGVKREVSDALVERVASVLAEWEGVDLTTAKPRHRDSLLVVARAVASAVLEWKP